ncbi:hypothetical protein [Rufibacter psychrotolerans]|uniref:hypothetical protein n=1 Tax=Rufibacter psychrotolerans TaxID=2812556 RepID=UPI0019679AB7|nr:hypothetical protein [Rufibacter sp. SYSU D00308]
MAPEQPPLSFLQQLFEQDTLYVLPEEQGTPAAPAPVPAVAAAPVAEVNPTPPVTPAPAEAKTPRLPEFPEKVVAPVAKGPAPEITWWGEAVKGTYLLFEVPEPVFQQLPQHAFLQKVLAAVGLSTSQVKFGNLSRQVEHDVKQIAATQRASAILLFGQGLPVANLSRMEFYRMYRSGESRFVLVDSLEDIEKSVELKKKLWDVLQKIFLQQN